MARRVKQLSLSLSTWGGKRKGAGRKPKGKRALVSHLSRPSLSRHQPLHVTLRRRDDAWNLRAGRMFKPLKRAFVAGGERFGMRLVRYSVQGNHIHLIVEAHDKPSLSHGMQWLAARVARTLNGLMGIRGRVWRERYHAHTLTAPREVRNTLVYVLMNARKHGVRLESGIDPCSSAAWFDGFADHRPLVDDNPVSAPRTWLAGVGYTESRPINMRPEL